MVQGTGGCSMTMSSSGGMGWGGLGGGSFQCQTTSFSSWTDADGRTHTEEFSSSTVGDSRRGARETKQAYSNSASGKDKMSIERQLGDQGRKVVKERCRTSGEERQMEMFRGIDEKQAGIFDTRWEEAAAHIPQHRPGRMRLRLAQGRDLYEPYGGRASRQAALPAPDYGHGSSCRSSAPAANGQRAATGSSPTQGSTHQRRNWEES